MAISINSFRDIPVYQYSDIRPIIRSGDLLLCSGTSVFSSLIQTTTNSIWSHVGFIIRLPAIDRIMVLESVESIGVRTVTLSSYVQNYNGTEKRYPGKIVIARHDHFRPENISSLSKTAIDRLGYPYNTEEIIQIAAKITLKNIGLTPPAPNTPPTKAYICSEYASECYRSVGITIPNSPDNGFISPADFARTPDINAVGIIQS